MKQKKKDIYMQRLCDLPPGEYNTQQMIDHVFCGEFGIRVGVMILTRITRRKLPDISLSKRRTPDGWRWRLDVLCPAK